MSQFSDVLDQYLEDVWMRDPVFATYVGIHKYDDLLGHFDPESIDDRYHTRSRFLKTFRALDRATFTADEQLDCSITIAELEAEEKLHSLKEWERSPQMYMEHITNGIYFLTVRETVPLDKRLASIAGRLRQVPNFLEIAKKNLSTTTPALFVDIALQMAEGAKEFLEGVVPQLAEQVPYLKDDVNIAIGASVEAISSYMAFLEEFRDNAKGEYAIGRDLFDFLLKNYHMLDMDSRQLREFGERKYEETEKLLETLASEIDPSRTWMELIDDFKKVHPAGDNLLEAYSAEMKKARDYCRDKGIVSFPAKEVLKVIYTPVFLESTIPYAAYEPPPPFEDSWEGLFYVTAPTKDASPEIQEQQLQGHSTDSLPIVALHEAYPGHHLQLSLTKELDSKVCRQSWSTVFGEGWALYCEDMMQEVGYYDDPRVRLLQAQNTIWRAARVIVDVGLHVDGMSFQEAVDFMVDKARLERPNAEAEVRRYTTSPTQPMSYLVGKTLILEMRAEYERKLGDKFSLKAFHDHLLSYGAIQPKLVRERLLKE